MEVANITLLSDLGLQDASVSVVKGILLQYFPEVTITDISHEVHPYNIEESAYLLKSAYNYFPKNTIHIVICELFTFNINRIQLIESNGQYFIAPENGLLSLTLRNKIIQSWVLNEELRAFPDWVHLIGKIIKNLNTTQHSEVHFTNHIQEKPQTYKYNYAENSQIQCNVIHIDTYENIVLDILHEHFKFAYNDKRYRLTVMENEHITDIDIFIHNIKQGYKYARFNRAEHLEIGIKRGNAASLFGIKREMKNQKITIIIHDNTNSKNEIF